MSRHQSCPDPARLKDLLAGIDGILSEDERAALTAHLDGCESCQRALEEAAAGGSSLLNVACHIRERPPARSAYWNALRRVEGTTPVPGWAESPAATRLETPPPESGTSEEIALDFLEPSDNPEFLGKIDHFSIVRVIGKGGMGIVLEALDRCLQRRVAIKVLNPEFAANETAKERFWREAKAAAAVTHENVVAIHQVVDCGCEGGVGLPYLVMQLISGTSLEDHIAAHGPLPLTDVLRIGAQAAAGLAAAHRQGLIHRDVKPANILLESDLQRAKLTDFGLARAAEDVRLTQTGFVPGTPLYMAPEQARGEQVDHRADVFSLGSVLYAMCTGRPPFKGSTPFVILKSVTEEQPPAIASINPEIPAWLVDIIDKLHAKKPQDRFQSAAEVAEVLSRALRKIEHLTEDQKRACAKAAALRRTVDLGRRRFLWMGLGAVLGAGGTLAATALRRRATGAAGEDGPSVAPLATLNARVGPIWSVDFSPDGSTLAMAIDDGTVKLWETRGDNKVLVTIPAHHGPVWSVRFSPDGQRLATASDDGTVKLWDAATGKELRAFKHPAPVRPVVFSPDGARLLTGGRNGIVRLWDIDTEKAVFEAQAHAGILMALSFAPDGRTFATAGSDKVVKLWNVANSNQEKLVLPGHTASVYTVAFSSDGRKLASGSWDRTVRLWDAGAGEPLSLLTGHTLDVWSVAFAPDGKTLASGSEDRTVKLWDAATGQELTTFRGHGATVYAVTFSRDGKVLASGGRDGTVKLWDPATRS
jgi:WD40 repeat protein/tRNA A-37 threonylcarbamoyl transferase component Bud32